jgi:hypothetical protein
MPREGRHETRTNDGGAPHASAVSVTTMAARTTQPDSPRPLEENGGIGVATRILQLVGALAFELLAVALAVITIGCAVGVAHPDADANQGLLALFMAAITFAFVTATFLAATGGWWLIAASRRGRRAHLLDRYGDLIERRHRAVDWGREHPKVAGAGVAVVVVAAVLALLLTRETASSYCHGIYDNNGSTPTWAANEHSFSDFDSCVEWYGDAADQARP